MQKYDSITFPERRLGIIPGAETYHFWHAPRRYLFIRLIERYRSQRDSTFLDIGCGNGALVELLRRRGIQALGVDPYAARAGTDPHVFTRGTAANLPFASRSLPMVGMFDVLEHVDDLACLREVVRVLEPGGLLFLSVPACPGLWSKRDELAGHRRRYTRTTLRRILTASGLQVESLFGYQAILLPLLACSRWWSRRRPQGVGAEDVPPPWIQALLSIPNWLEVVLSPWIRFPIGSSLVAVCRSPG
jgi:SAM-dependent methyltransferase